MPRVLVVEDDQPLSRAIKLGLEKEKIECEVANDGEEALSILDKDKNFDLMLLDLLMPNMGGFRLLEEMYSLDLKIPIVVSTNSQEMQHKYKAKRYGVVKYMIKAETPLWLLIDKIKEILKLDLQKEIEDTDGVVNPA